MGQKDFGSIYLFLMANKETEELGKRLLLDQCFMEETKQSVRTMDRASGIVRKINEKSRDKETWYPMVAHMWLQEADDMALLELKARFAEKSTAYLLQSLVFENMVEGDARNATALMEW